MKKNTIILSALFLIITNNISAMEPESQESDPSVMMGGSLLMGSVLCAHQAYFISKDNLYKPASRWIREKSKIAEEIINDYIQLTREDVLIENDLDQTVDNIMRNVNDYNSENDYPKDTYNNKFQDNKKQNLLRKIEKYNNFMEEKENKYQNNLDGFNQNKRFGICFNACVSTLAGLAGIGLIYFGL